MTDHEFSDYLAAKSATVVHLSHHSIMNPDRPIFPEDMRRVIAMKNEINLSCVVAWPGHAMSLPGSVGVIFKPTCANVISVSNTDSGSTSLSDGSDGSRGFPLSLETLASSFDVKFGNYNEWRVRGAQVVGIFVADRSNIQVKKENVLRVGEHECKFIGETPIDLDEVFTEFPHHSVFTMGLSGLIEIPRS